MGCPARRLQLYYAYARIFSSGMIFPGCLKNCLFYLQYFAEHINNVDKIESLEISDDAGIGLTIFNYYNISP